MRLQMPAIVERDRQGRRARIYAFVKPDRVLFLTVLVAALVVILRCLPLVAVPYRTKSTMAKA
jgi:cell division protein FtsL